MATIHGAIPGRLEEIRYIRTGRQAGPYKHRFRSSARIYAMTDGSLWIKGKEGLWLDNPPRSRRRRWSYNDFLAAYNPGGGHMRHKRHHHRRHHRYHHNPDVVTGAIRHPAAFLTEGVAVLGGIYGVVTAGNLIRTFLPATIVGTGWQATAVNLGTRAAAAYALDTFVGPMLGHANRTAVRVGLVVGLGGSLILDLLGTSFHLGKGDTAQMPLDLVRGFRLAGVGQYDDLGIGAYSTGELRSIGATVRTPWRRLGARPASASGTSMFPMNQWRAR